MSLGTHAIFDSLQEQYPQLIHKARGVGTFCAFNGRTVDIRDKLLCELKNNGMHDFFSNSVTS